MGNKRHDIGDVAVFRPFPGFSETVICIYNAK